MANLLAPLLVAIFCSIAPWLPDPFGSNSYILSLVGLALLIVTGLRADFRHDKAGPFAFWFRPIQMSKATLDRKEKLLVNLGLVLAVVPLLSIALRMVFLASS